MSPFLTKQTWGKVSHKWPFSDGVHFCMAACAIHVTRVSVERCVGASLSAILTSFFPETPKYLSVLGGFSLFSTNDIVDGDQVCDKI